MQYTRIKNRAVTPLRLLRCLSSHRRTLTPLLPLPVWPQWRSKLLVVCCDHGWQEYIRRQPPTLNLLVHTTKTGGATLKLHHGHRPQEHCTAWRSTVQMPRRYWSGHLLQSAAQQPQPLNTNTPHAATLARCLDQNPLNTPRCSHSTRQHSYVAQTARQHFANSKRVHLRCAQGPQWWACWRRQQQQRAHAISC